MSTLHLCGAGNVEGVRLALSINRESGRWDRIVILDDDPAKHGALIMGSPISGPFEMLGDTDPHTAEVANLVGRNTTGRWSARRKIDNYCLPYATLIHRGVDTTGVEFETNLTVYANAILGAQSKIQDGTVVLPGAVVGHGARIGRGCIIAPNAVVNARVQLGDGVYVGTNATILPDVKVGRWATVAAGSVAMQDVPAGATVMGVPAKIVISLELRLKLKGPETLPEELRRELERLADRPSYEATHSTEDGQAWAIPAP